MTLTDLLRELQNRDIDLYFHSGKLRCNAPRGALDMDLRSAIDVYRAEIYTLFATTDKSPSVERSRAPRRCRSPSRSSDCGFSISSSPGTPPTTYRARCASSAISTRRPSPSPSMRSCGGTTCSAPPSSFATARATQVIAPALEIATPIIDLGGLDEQMREAEALRLAAEEARRPFDLATGPLLRVKTLDLGVRPATAERERVVLFTMHHIVSDGWSSGVLLREFVALYEARRRRAAVAFAGARHSICRLRGVAEGMAARRGPRSQLAYWREKLGGAPPRSICRPIIRDRRGRITPERVDAFTIGKHVADRLAALGREEGATLFMTLLAAFQLLLSRYSGQHDISVGDAGRQSPPSRARGADRLLREHAGDARRSVGRSELPRAAGARARDRARRSGASGPAVRAARRGACGRSAT